MKKVSKLKVKHSSMYCTLKQISICHFKTWNIDILEEVTGLEHLIELQIT